jgi:hypothetical protein
MTAHPVMALTNENITVKEAILLFFIKTPVQKNNYLTKTDNHRTDTKHSYFFCSGKPKKTCS